MTSSIPLLPRRGGFTFKQFFVGHDRCGMKVSTDGVLLGAWAPLPSPAQVLDIGTGSGLLTLMLAQRFSEQGVQYRIDALDIDENAIEQARENIALSPWANNVRLWQQDFLTWSPDDRKYHLIVCNPPYYAAGKDFRDDARATARNSASLNHRDLLDRAAALLAVDGFFCVVLPVIESEAFTQYASKSGWYLARRCLVAEREQREAHRVLMAWRREAVHCQEQYLILRDQQGCYSEQFSTLTKDFYLTL